ncbi:MAG: ATP synthase F1 subunit delta [Caldilineaceae bacterium]|jgi:F-type H+-transporting ATPase subunit delta
MNTNSASANQYAQAIMGAMLERWQGALSSVSVALKQNPQLAERLSNAAYGVNERLSALEGVLPADAPIELRNTLKLMVQDGALHLVDQLGEALSQVATGRSSAPTKAEVVSAVALSAEEQAELRRSLAVRYGEGLTFAFSVDPSLMGGLRVRVGDRLIDTSVASRLQAMRETLASVVR